MFKFVGICFNLRSYGVDLRFLFLASLPPIFQKSRKKIFSKLYLNLLDKLLLFSFRLKNIIFPITNLNKYFFGLTAFPYILHLRIRIHITAFLQAYLLLPSFQQRQIQFEYPRKNHLPKSTYFSKFSFLITFRSDLVPCVQEVVTHFIQQVTI